MRIAVVGSGISGLSAAHLLSRSHVVVLFEASDERLGGHTHTHTVSVGGRDHRVDTGFIVFNDWTYPRFMALMRSIGVTWQPSDMSFSVRSEVSGLEYNGTSLNSLFAQRSNLFRPSFLGMVREILRFNREAPALLEDPEDGPTLGEYLEAGRYGEPFVRDYILPMGAAIWSATRSAMLAFPAKYFVRFFANHGFLSVDERPVWQVVRGGSSAYIEPITRPFADRIRRGAPVDAVRRCAGHVEVRASGGEFERFDHVVLACHSDQALKVLSDPTEAERDVLGAIGYQANEVLLHTDASIMPRKRLAWAAWNYHLTDHAIGESDAPVAVTYWMNKLQSLEADEEFLVTLNWSDRIDPAKVLRRLLYHHPVYTHAAVRAQGRWDEVSSHARRTWYCGAYWFSGFHEDGVRSGLRVAEAFGERLEGVEA
ncbi:MAG: NAD(P)/FAD-dependent oxidoreductase [Planctomycetota bacterium]|jgi:predicted NAD/FAD-binding protein